VGCSPAIVRCWLLPETRGTVSVEGERRREPVAGAAG
jgi:hypothetical protein